jgi:hypothetical protein
MTQEMVFVSVHLVGTVTELMITQSDSEVLVHLYEQQALELGSDSEILRAAYDVCHMIV